MQTSRWRKLFALLTSSLLLFSSFSPLMQVVLAEALDEVQVTEPVKEEVQTEPVVEEQLSAEDPSGSITEEAVMTENTQLVEEPSVVEVPVVEEDKPIWTVSEGGLYAVTTENVVAGKTYVAPFNDLLTVRFEEINGESGLLSFRQILLSEEERTSLGAVSNIAYDVSSTMQDGTFKYVMTLPTGEVNTGNLEVMYAESVGELDNALSAGEVSEVGGYVTLGGMDHFTVFVVVTDTITSVNHGVRSARYVGDPAPSGYSNTYEWLTPHLVCDPNHSAVTFTGTIDLKDMDNGATSMIGLIDQDLLENGYSGYRSGAYVYIHRKSDTKVKIGTSDGEWYGTSSLNDTEYRIPENKILNLTVTIFNGGITVTVGTHSPIWGWYGIVKVKNNSWAEGLYAAPEFANGAIPGWDSYDRNTMPYTFNVTGCTEVLPPDTTGPDAPEIIFPNPEQNFLTQPILNDWTDVTDPSGIAYYRVEYTYDDGHHFVDEPYRTAIVSERNHTPADSEQGGVSFRVQAFDNAGNEGAWSEWRHYYYDYTLPETPTPVSPFDGAMITGDAFDQTWTGSSDTVLYEYQSCNVDPGDLDEVCGDVKWTATFTGTVKHVDAGQPNSHFWWRVRARDEAGNWSPWSVAFELYIDVEAPVSAFVAPNNGSTWNSPISLEGLSTDNFGLASLDIYIADAGTTNWVLLSHQEPAVIGVPSWTWYHTFTPAEGTYDLKAEATDVAGNVEHTAYLSGITYDVTAPATPTWGTIYAGHDPATWTEVGCGGYTNTPQVTMVWNPNSEIDIDGYWFGTKLNSKHQYISAPVVQKTGNMTPGNNPYYYTIIAVDKAGNESSISEKCGLILDQQAPLSVFKAPSDNSIWKDPIPLAGNTLDDYGVAAVNLYWGQKETDNWSLITTLYSGSLTKDWNWDYLFTPAVEGTFDIKATAVDEAGNIESTAYLYDITYDITAPQVPTNYGFNIPGGNYWEPRPNVELVCGGITNSNQVSHQWSDESASGAVQYMRQWQYPGSVVWQGAELWSTPYTNYRNLGTSIGVEGLWHVRVKAKDAAGNWSEYSTPCAFTYDRTSPVVDITSHEDGGPAVNGVIDITGTVQDTNLLRYWFVVQNISGVQVAGPGTVNNDGPTVTPTFTWNTVNYPDGLYTIKLEARDKAGNKTPDPVTGDPNLVGDSVDWVTIEVDNYGSISGLKLRDVNGDGELGEGDHMTENRLDGWDIQLYDASQTLLRTMQTGGDHLGTGEYAFTGLLSGWYFVCEVPKTGWVQTYPEVSAPTDLTDGLFSLMRVTVPTMPGCHSIYLEPGDETTEVFFGNFELGRISGKKWNDVDQDGIWDETEDELPGWTIVMPQEERSDVTDDEGYYDFGDLMPGSYLVCEELQEGWVQTFPGSVSDLKLMVPSEEETPEGCHLVVINTSGQHVSEINFGNYLDTQPVVSITTNPGDSTILSAITLTAEVLLDSGNEPVVITGWEQVGGDAFPGCTGTDNSVVTPSTPGTYTCKVTVEDLDGDTATATKTVVVNPNPIVDLLPTVVLYSNIIEYNAGGVVYAPANSTFSIVANLNNLGNPNYNYTFGGICTGNIIGSGSATFVSNTLSLSVGTYTCSVTVVDSDGDVAIASAPIIVTGVLGIGTNLETEEQPEEEDEPSVAGAATCETTYKLSGYVYDDKNGNDIIDEGETRLGNVEVTISSDGFSETVLTNADGYWELDVCPGDYQVTVKNTDLPAGYSVSTEDEKQVEASVNDEDVEGINISASSSVPAFPWWIILLILLAAMGTGGYYLYRRQNGELQMK